MKSFRFDLFALYVEAFDSGCSKWPSYRDFHRGEGTLSSAFLGSSDPGMMNISLVIRRDYLYIVKES